jgi:hypothetical protein
VVREFTSGRRRINNGAVLKMTLTHERLRQLLLYDPLTGVFTWRQEKIKGRHTCGASAGHVDASGYCKISVDGQKYYAHRLAWFYHYACWPAKNIDHIDRCRSNNRISNLRDVSQSKNGLNGPLRRNNASGFTGVIYDGRRKNWVAYITIARKKKHLGSYRSLELACKARKQAEARQ